jgi:serine/threonine-protein kinase
VAVKVLKESEHASPKEREQYHARFRHEAEAAGRLNHPDIVQVYDVGPTYMVMEFLEGRTLAALLKEGVTLAVGQVASLILRVADAVDYAHRHGIVHRDVKPANIMLMNDGGVKVMDFGVARLESSTLTVAGTVVGSVRYMAPEQMLGEKVDGRADVFSLAGVAYELLTGRAPFPGKTITEIVSRVVRGAFVPPKQANAALTDDVNAVFARAFAPKPADRYERAMDFARDLHEAARPILELEVRHEGQPAAVPRPEPAATTVRAATAPTLRGTAQSVTGSGVFMASAKPVTREGVLMLDSDPPGAQIYVDGSPVGPAPVAGLDLAFGRHVVRMEAPGRESVSAEIELKRERPLKAVTFTLPPPGSSPDAVKPGQYVPFGPQVTPPKRISGAVPAYPEAARERGMEGSPVVEVWVSETGDVIDVAIVESAGAILDGALLEAVTTWRFEPARVKDVPVSTRITVQHLFRR